MLYPHQNLEILQQECPQDPMAFARQLGSVMAAEMRVAPAFVGIGRWYEPGRAAIFSAIEGGARGADLQDKLTFGAIATELGYQSPSSVLVIPDKDKLTLLESINDLDASDGRRFCKPLHGAAGRGTFIAYSAEEVISRTSSKREPYLVQPFRPGKDGRYILHRGPQQHQDEPPKWRLGYQKTSPQVVGDGDRTVSELLVARNDLNNDIKLRYGKRLSHTLLSSIPEDSEIVDFSPRKGFFHRELFDSIAERNLDVLMRAFMRDVERHIGRPLSVFPVDFAITNEQYMNDPEATLEQLKKSVVFYEFQLPFDGRHTPMDSRGLINRRRISWTFTCSIFATGRQLSKLS